MAKGDDNKNVFGCYVEWRYWLIGIGITHPLMANWGIAIYILPFRFYYFREKDV